MYNTCVVESTLPGKIEVESIAIAQFDDERGVTHFILTSTDPRGADAKAVVADGKAVVKTEASQGVTQVTSSTSTCEGNALITIMNVKATSEQGETSFLGLETVEKRDGTLFLEIFYSEASKAVIRCR